MAKLKSQSQKYVELKEEDYLGTFIKYYKISQLIHTQSIAN